MSAKFLICSIIRLTSFTKGWHKSPKKERCLHRKQLSPHNFHRSRLPLIASIAQEAPIACDRELPKAVQYVNLHHAKNVQNAIELHWYSSDTLLLIQFTPTLRRELVFTWKLGVLATALVHPGLLKVFSKFLCIHSSNSISSYFSWLNRCSFVPILVRTGWPNHTCLWAESTYKVLGRFFLLPNQVVAGILFSSAPGVVTWSQGKVFRGQKSMKCTPGVLVV